MCICLDAVYIVTHGDLRQPLSTGRNETRRCLSFSSVFFFPPPLCSHIVIRFSVGSTLGLTAVTGIMKARKFSNQMVTKRKSL